MVSGTEPVRDGMLNGNLRRMEGRAKGRRLARGCRREQGRGLLCGEVLGFRIGLCTQTRAKCGIEEMPRALGASGLEPDTPGALTRLDSKQIHPRPARYLACTAYMGLVSSPVVKARVDVERSSGT